MSAEASTSNDAAIGSPFGDAKDHEWVTLISQDGYHFVLDYRCAILSGTIRSMLGRGQGGEGAGGSSSGHADFDGSIPSPAPGINGDNGAAPFSGGFAEAETLTANLNQIRGVVLEKVVEYLVWKQKYNDSTADTDIPHFQNRIPPEIALELLMAADFLDV